MAQVSLGQTDLRKALLGVLRPIVGARCPTELYSLQFKEVFPNVPVPPPQFYGVFERLINMNESHVINTEEEYFSFFESMTKHPAFQFDKLFLSGSLSEGLAIYQDELPDHDIMMIFKNISFSEEDQKCGNLTMKEDTAFVNAYITNEESLKLWEDFLEDPAGEDTTRRQLSSRKLKAMHHDFYEKRDAVFNNQNFNRCKTMGDGPSLELTREISLPHGAPVKEVSWSADIIISIRCDGWPHCAWEWPQRDRLWPDKNLVQKISQDGFYIVPKSSLEGNFRLSFSNAETTLIENLTPLQHKVIRAFKAVIKYHQSNWSPNIKDIICTYHLKTIAFWHIEKTTQDSWTEGNVVSHLLLLIEEFAEALKKGNLPMYFLPKYNLLGNVENSEEMKKISAKVVELSKDIHAITTAVKKVANATDAHVHNREL